MSQAFVSPHQNQKVRRNTKKKVSPEDMEDEDEDEVCHQRAIVQEIVAAELKSARDFETAHVQQQVQRALDKEKQRYAKVQDKLNKRAADAEEEATLAKEQAANAEEKAMQAERNAKALRQQLKVAQKRLRRGELISPKTPASGPHAVPFVSPPESVQFNPEHTRLRERGHLRLRQVPSQPSSAHQYDGYNQYPAPPLLQPRYPHQYSADVEQFEDGAYQPPQPYPQPRLMYAPTGGYFSPPQKPRYVPDYYGGAYTY